MEVWSDFFMQRNQLSSRIFLSDSFLARVAYFSFWTQIAFIIQHTRDRDYDLCVPQKPLQTTFIYHNDPKIDQKKYLKGTILPIPNAWT